jgi:ribose transport system substrate-binding protein
MSYRFTRAGRVASCCAALALTAGVAACGSSGSNSSSETSTGGATAATNVKLPSPPTGVQKFEAAKPGSGKGLTIGFTQLTLAAGFPQDVQKGMEQQAKIAGVKLITCDSNADGAKALDCARNFKTQGVNALITFQPDTNASPRICAAGPKVPVIAVDIEQKPCEVSFMGAANTYAGELVGYNVGKYFKQKFGCKYDAFLSLESLAVGVVNELRMGGIRKGFESVCGKIHGLRKIDTGPGGLADPAQKKMTDTLTALPGQHKVIVVGINEDVTLGALAAARSQNRTNDLYLGVQNLNPKNCTIYRDPNWIGSVAYFPEHYAEILMPYIIKAAKGDSIPKELLVPHVFITKDTVKKYYPNYNC